MRMKNLMLAAAAVLTGIVMAVCFVQAEPIRTVQHTGAVGPTGVTGTTGVTGNTGPAGAAFATTSHTGAVVYSDATAATTDTGTLTCTSLSPSKTCVTTYLPDGTNANCSNDYNTGSGTPFFSVCR